MLICFEHLIAFIQVVNNLDEILKQQEQYIKNNLIQIQ